MLQKTSQMKPPMKWTWMIIIAFFIIGIYDARIGLLGFLCMLAPLYHALKGHGKVHCTKYCPRGSFLGQFLPYVTMDHTLPKWMNSKIFKHGLLVFMMTIFSLSVYNAAPDITQIGLAIFRFILYSSIVSVLLGILFKPRSWCQVCPMGHLSGMIKDSKTKQK